MFAESDPATCIATLLQRDADGHALLCTLRGCRRTTQRPVADCDHISSFTAGLQKHYPDDKRRVAILTPYKAQMRKLRSVFTASVASGQMANLDFATVDGFQARCLCLRQFQEALAYDERIGAAAAMRSFSSHHHAALS